MRTLPDLFAAAAPRPDLVVHDDLRLGHAALDRRIERFAAALNGRGIGRGDRVAFQLPVGVDALVVYRGCWRVGVVAVALHPMAGEAQLHHALDLSEPALTLSTAGFALAGVNGVGTVDEMDGGAVPEGSPDPDDDAVIMFTSGSSGTPKGVVHTHASLSYKASQSIDVHGFTADDVVLMPAPLAHVSGLLHGVLVPGALGAKTVLMSRWDPGRALDLVEAESVTWMIGPPTFFLGLMDHPGFAPDRVASLRLVSCGGAGVTPAFAERARRPYIISSYEQFVGCQLGGAIQVNRSSGFIR